MEYTSSLEGLRPEHLDAFFEGWQSPPCLEKRLDLLRGSSEVILAKDEQGVLIGFVTAISDGVLAAYIPLLEVIPSA
ncbi:MAG: GNAT family N-acetyltransferase, partial [Candidatus Nanopelagicales bacterium]